MAVKEILELENNRDSSTLGKIYFYKEGNSPWYRAYELSAYFASFYDNGLDDKKRLHAVKKCNKSSEDGIISVGLQLPSFKKYFPDVNVDDMSGDRFSLDISIDSYDGINASNYKEKVSEWKSGFSTNQKKEHSSKNIYSSPVSFTAIMKEIIRCDTYNKSENELRDFICTLKEMCANLI